MWGDVVLFGLRVSDHIYVWCQVYVSECVCVCVQVLF